MKSYSDLLSHEKTNTSTVTNIYEIGACCEFNELSHNVNANRNNSVHTLILKKISLNVTHLKQTYFLFLLFCLFIFSYFAFTISSRSCRRALLPVLLFVFVFFYYIFCHVSNVVWKRIYYMSNYYRRIFQTSLIWPRNSDQDNLFHATVFSFAKETFTITRKPDWLHCAKNNI